MILGNKLKSLRMGKSYSQDYVAIMLNMSQPNYCKLEHDHHQPNNEVIEKIIALYNITLHELMADDGADSIQVTENSGQITPLAEATLSPSELQIIHHLLESKNKIIALQDSKITSLEEQLQALKRE